MKVGKYLFKGRIGRLRYLFIILILSFVFLAINKLPDLIVPPPPGVSLGFDCQFSDATPGSAENCGRRSTEHSKKLEAWNKDFNNKAPIYTFNILCTFFIFIFATSKRLHDVSQTGFIQLIPLAAVLAGSYFFNNLILGALIMLATLLVLFIHKGTPGPNKYGPDPLEKIL